MEKEFKNCPICKEPVLLCHRANSMFPMPLWSFHCPKCEMMFCLEDFGSEKKTLIKAWNRRAGEE